MFKSNEKEALSQQLKPPPSVSLLLANNYFSGIFQQCNHYDVKCLGKKTRKAIEI